LALAAALFVLIGAAVPAHAQTLPRPTGNVSMMGDWFPNRVATEASPFVGPTFRSGVNSEDSVMELRARVFVEQKIVPSERISFTFSGFAEGLLGRSETGIARVHEATTAVRLGRFDLSAGYGRVVWGRLDELQPTDVINPLDISRFFFEGRSEARLPVALVRGRWHFTDAVSIDAVYVPFFRRGRFDQLEESTSPFNIVPAFRTPDVTCLAIGCPPLVIPVDRLEPSARWSHAQGGTRLNATTGTVDWSVSAYRGFEAFGLYQAQARPPIAPFTTPQAFVEERFPRFTMIGADFESVVRQWGIRGELAAFVRDSFQGDHVEILEGSSLDAGLGVDRKAGRYRLSATVLLHHERTPHSAAPAPCSASEHPSAPCSTLAERSEASLLLSADRTFRQERYQLRAFSVSNPSERSSFLRSIFIAKLRDDLAFEASGGWFAGDGRDAIGRFNDSDFLYGRLRYDF
jgi:hypothetical protein